MECSLGSPIIKSKEGSLKKAILVVSFGSSIEEARNKAIFPIEGLIEEKYSDFTIARAYTSNFIRKKLAKQGIQIDSASEAIEKLIHQGYEEIYIQPLHILAGFEFEKIEEAVRKLAKPELVLRLGKPLMATKNDLDPIVNALEDHDGLTIYIGHGTDHPINHLYEKLEEKLLEKNRYTWVGTVEEGPKPMLKKLEKIMNHSDRKNHKTKVLLKPFLLVAGDHVINDINGPEEDSWVSSFRENGYEVMTDLRGLGEIHEFQQLFVNQVSQLVGKGN